MEDIQTRHKKELKTLDGEKRAAIKKAKALKGKKGKDALESVEAEFDAKLKDLEDKHEKELVVCSPGVAPAETTSLLPETQVSEPEPLMDSAEAERLKKVEKARRKRDAKKEKEKQRQEELEKETAEAGPSMRRIELDALEQQLKPLSLNISEIPSDGNCLYRAVAAQSDSNYAAIRNICANVLMKNKDDYAPFIEYTDTVTTFEQYVERVRSSSDWGGHLELRALSDGLKRPIFVWSAMQPKLVIGDEDGLNPILLSYHLHYYSLGEHYNQVIKSSGDEN